MIEFDEFAAILQKSAARIRPAMVESATELGVTMKKTAQQELIGHEIEEWPPLAESTVAEKARLGYTGRVSPTDPLLRTGEMRDSIDFAVAEVLDGVTLVLGSSDAIAVYQEMGTAHIPPRPFLATASIRSLPLFELLFGELAASLLAPPRA